uniref:CAP10 domain-containing protein n=1 Tax=Caenorhabditis tropicalis TaxID=1561998 RepID=A0A1I7TW23_9PELO
MRDAFIDFLKPPDYDSFGNLPKSDENTHVTCVHTRRGDFVEYNFYSSDPVFIRNALIFMNQKTPRSTFGFWMGYFSSGDTVFHLDVRYASDYVTESGNFTSNDFFLPHWTPLMFSSSDNLTVVESFK